MTETAEQYEQDIREVVCGNADWYRQYVCKVPPNDLQCEMDIMGAILFGDDHRQDIMQGLRPTDFYTDANRRIFEEASKLYEAGTLISKQTLVDRLRPEYAEYLDRCEIDAFYLGHVDQRIRRLRSLGLKREMRTLGLCIVAKAVDDVMGASAADDAEWALTELRTLVDASREVQAMLPMREVVTRVMDGVEARLDGKQAGVESGIYELDDLTGGWQRTDLWIIAARPSIGKTATAIQFCRHAAEHGEPVALFSLEMSAEQIGQRIVFGSAEVDSTIVRNGQIEPRHMQAIQNATGKLCTIPLTVSDMSMATVNDISSMVRRLTTVPRIICVDYLQIMRAVSQRDNRNLDIGDMTAGLKALAKDTKATVLLLSQLNRGVEGRSDKTPTLADLRDSGNIEQDADGVILLQRPEKKEGGAVYEELIMHIAKHRNGRTGKVRALLNPVTGRIVNRASEAGQ